MVGIRRRRRKKSQRRSREKVSRRRNYEKESRKRDSRRQEDERLRLEATDKEKEHREKAAEEL